MEKRQIKLKIGKDKVINVLVDRKLKDQKIIEMIKKGVKKAIDYFNDVKIANFGIELTYSRAEFDERMGQRPSLYPRKHSGSLLWEYHEFKKLQE